MISFCAKDNYQVPDFCCFSSYLNLKAEAVNKLILINAFSMCLMGHNLITGCQFLKKYDLCICTKYLWRYRATLFLVWFFCGNPCIYKGAMALVPFTIGLLADLSETELFGAGKKED